MNSIRIGQIIYNYNNKYELYYKVCKNFHLKYRDKFKNLRTPYKKDGTISISLINNIEFHFDASEHRTDEWKKIIKEIQHEQSNKKDEKIIVKDVTENLNIPLKNAVNRKKKDSSYLKLFPNQSSSANMAADLATAIHSTSISEGVKLEKYIYDEFKGLKFEGLKFSEVIKLIFENINETILFRKIIIDQEIINENTNYNHTRSKNLHLDLLIFYENQLFIDELKDGDSLDTKKSDVEIQEIKMIKELFENTTKFNCNSSIVLWTCQDIENASIKTIDANDYILRGRDLCKTLNIGYDLIEEKRKMANEGNLGFVINEMEKIIDVYKKEKQ